MLTLNPAESFPIVRVLKDHSDTDTRYVQAVIRDATMDTLIATVNLDDKGSRRFQKVWKVTYDNAYSQGRYIVITTTVYDDSGYTSKSLNYQEEAETYLVQQRWWPGAYGGGGGTIDYRKLRKIMNEVIASSKSADKLPESVLMGAEKPEDVLDLDKFVEDITNKVTEQISKMSIPEPEKPEIDLSHIEDGLINLAVKIASVPNPQPMDFSGVINAIQELGNELKTISEKQNEKLQSYFENL